MTNINSAAVLRFWRDVEIFNIPAVPKKETKNTKEGKLRLKVSTFTPGSHLPWEPGHPNTLCSTEKDEWSHAVFVGVANTKELASVVMKAVSSGANLDEGDLQRLNGHGWIAAFEVNDQGKVIPESYVPASFALGIQRIKDGKTLDDLNADIKVASDNFDERRKIVLAPQEEEGDAGSNGMRPENSNAHFALGWKELKEEIQNALQLVGDIEPSTASKLIVKSTLRSRRSKSDDVNIDFLNSFYLDDLDLLISEADKQKPLGAALTSYLGPASPTDKRRDILTQNDAMAECLSPAKLTLGRWPAKKMHHLMLAQQAAVGEIAALHNASGLVAVNGPPGTGKTTLLCDVIADVVVRRAKALAGLTAHWEAYGPKTTAGGMPIFPMKAEIVGLTGIVVSSNNNAAVENITKELPFQKKIAGDEHTDAGYFRDVASRVFQAPKNIAIDEKQDDEGESADPNPVWALIAAALGNSDNRRTFANAFVAFGKLPPYMPGEPCDIKTILDAQKNDGKELWDRAKADFLDLLAKVESEQSRFAEIARKSTDVKRLRPQLPTTLSRLGALSAELESIPSKWAAMRVRAEALLGNAKKAESDATDSEQKASLAVEAASDHLEAEKNSGDIRVLDRFLKFFGYRTDRICKRDSFIRELLTARANCSDAWGQAIERRSYDKKVREQCERDLTALLNQQRSGEAQLHREISATQKELENTKAIIQRYEQGIAEFMRVTNATVPDDRFFSQNIEDRHLACAWVSSDFDFLRAKLFLAALRLHEVTVLANSYKAKNNFDAVKAMLLRSTPEPLSNEDRKILWEALFFAVPVVSTTLASFDRLFQGMGCESLGWLLIDEAGQATPQSVAGALWRSKRTVIIGDPLQVEPVMTVPTAVVKELRSKHKVDECWSPAKESAQTVADRTMKFGAYIGKNPETATWTGMPLRGHRRCIDPMFKVSNEIAYDGQMVQANKEVVNIDCILGESAWLDVHGQQSDGQVVADEIDVLIKALQNLTLNWPIDGKGKQRDVFVISPFRKVAEACSSALRTAGIKKPVWSVVSDTVHRFQGREADIVFIVLGSAPGRAGNGSRGWAAQKPNILNVALTRAKLRVYIIGSADEWGRCPQFDVLLRELDLMNRVLDANNFLGSIIQTGELSYR